MAATSFIVGTIFTLFFTLDTSIADDRQIPSTEDTSPLSLSSSLANSLDKILFEKDYENYRRMNPDFLETLVKYSRKNDQLSPKDSSLLEDRWQNNEILAEAAPSDAVDPFSQFVSDWLNKNDLKRKRAHHRSALCHFKICNMGLKRDYRWRDVWPYSNRPKAIANI